MNYSLEDTKELMISVDYQDRFKAEYIQLQIRINGLTEMLDDYKNGALSFKPSCSYDLLQGQLESMLMYMSYLDTRKYIEDIEI